MLNDETRYRILNAAALKQVPAAEYNSMGCVKMNVHGAESVIAAAIASEVARATALAWELLD